RQLRPGDAGQRGVPGAARHDAVRGAGRGAATPGAGRAGRDAAAGRGGPRGPCGRASQRTGVRAGQVRGRVRAAVPVRAGGDAAVRARLRAEWPDDLWPRIRLACVFHPDWAWAEGLTLAETAARAGQDPAEFTLDLLVTDKLRVGCVFERRPPTTEESVRTLL